MCSVYNANVYDIWSNMNFNLTLNQQQQQIQNHHATVTAATTAATAKKKTASGPENTGHCKCMHVIGQCTNKHYVENI